MSNLHIDYQLIYKMRYTIGPNMIYDTLLALIRYKIGHIKIYVIIGPNEIYDK